MHLFFYSTFIIILLINFQLLPSRSASTAVSGNIANLIQTAQNDYEAGNYASSINKYKKALEGNNNNPGIHFGLGAAYIGQGYYELATEYLLRALELNPALIEAYFSLALAYQGMGRSKEALAAYRKGLGFDLNKDLPRSAFWNEVNIKTDQPEEKNDDEDINSEENKSENKNLSTLKIKEFKPVIITDFSSPNSFENRNESVKAADVDESGLIIIKKDNNYFASQIKDYEEELENSSDDTQIMRRLAILYLKVKQLDKAQIMQRKLKNLNSEFSNEINIEIEKANKKIELEKEVSKPSKNNKTTWKK